MGSERKTPINPEEAAYNEVADFAFFAANFGYNRREYYELTPLEKMFLVKAYENRVVSDSQIMAAAVSNAVGNVFRKKGKPLQKLWKRKPKQGDLRDRQDNFKAAKETQERDGTDWIQKIYAANGYRRKRRKGMKTNGK